MSKKKKGTPRPVISLARIKPFTIEGLLEPFQARLCPEIPVFEMAIEAARDLSDTHPEFIHIINRWDKVTSDKDKKLPLALDTVVVECDGDLEQFKLHITRYLQAKARVTAENLITASLPELVEKSLQNAGDPIMDKGNVLLREHLRHADMMDKPPGQITNVNVSANAQSATVRQLPQGHESFTAMMQDVARKELPASVDGEVLDEARD